MSFLGANVYPAKAIPKVFRPIDSYAMVPARKTRLAELSLVPSFLIGHSRRAGFVQVDVSGQELSGAKRWLPAPPTATAIRHAVGARRVPGHADHQAAVMAPIRRPPILAVGHQALRTAFSASTIEFLTSSR